MGWGVGGWAQVLTGPKCSLGPSADHNPTLAGSFRIQAEILEMELRLCAHLHFSLAIPTAVDFLFCGKVFPSQSGPLSELVVPACRQELIVSIPWCADGRLVKVGTETHSLWCAVYCAT